MGWVLAAQSVPVVIKGVSFGMAIPRGEPSAWYEVAVEVEGVSEEETARAQPLVLGVEMAFNKRQRDLSFYRAQVAFLAPEAGDEALIYFYLPPGIVERDHLRGDPIGWRIQLSQEGRAFPQGDGSFSDSLRGPESARSFVQRVMAEGAVNDGWLQPIYLTPFFDADNGRLEDSPSYLRTELVTGG